MRRSSLLLLLALLAAAARAADAPPPVSDKPPLPAATDEREAIEPQVTITRKKDRTVTEYRINGELYMIKVTPAKGVPYYLMDTDGDGSLETRSNEIEPNLLIPSWVIFRW
ncbi:DUF2782 domain-containing protein [Thiohalobacter sp. IOR34]|uniref:DUF2782 domain-containing protein n=1 Tax=Thiohalobacter sp. IOR34 TaxID=3057176 RepID=UPI0025AED513|nr:DUF2782 domain-containing protein [Thiohalobacter sp. IOR34]WJW75466.1 DUF2782 domain-containing protein [Thiohalobacter sp. IOR34]